MGLDPWSILSTFFGGNPLAALGFLTVFVSVGVLPLLLGRLLALRNPSPQPQQEAPQLESSPPAKSETLRRWRGYAFWGLIIVILYLVLFVAAELIADINLLARAFVTGSVFLIAAFGLFAVLYWRKTKDSNDPNVVPADRLRGYFMGPIVATIVGYMGIMVLYHRGPRLEIPFLMAFTIIFSAQNVRRAFRT